MTKPLGVAVSPDGSRLYATQSGTNPATFVFDRDGQKIGELEPPATAEELHVPVYLAVDPTNGDVYVGDRAAGKVYVYDATRHVPLDLRAQGDAKAISPLGVAVGQDGTSTSPTC